MIKVLIVDDSAVVRKYLTEELGKHDDIQVVGTAMDPYLARDKIVELQPDVITLDLEMPRMDGLSFLARLMEHYPMPVVVVSSLTPRNSENALMALSLGAVDVICKPGSAYSTQDLSREVVKAVRAAAAARFDRHMNGPAPDRPARQIQVPARLIHTTDKIIAIGASTGGTRVLERLLPEFPPQTPGTVIVQHMPPVFTKSFADRLNRKCQVEVREARDGDLVEAGSVLIAPGNFHMQLEKRGARYYTRIRQGPPVHHHRPSVDVLFNSVARSAGVNATGVLLTGMGVDGASGLLEMRKNGAWTIAQDEQTSVVYGMPKRAVEIGAAQQVLPIDEIGPAILGSFQRSGATGSGATGSGTAGSGVGIAGGGNGD